MACCKEKRGVDVCVKKTRHVLFAFNNSAPSRNCYPQSDHLPINLPRIATPEAFRKRSGSVTALPEVAHLGAHLKNLKNSKKFELKAPNERTVFQVHRALNETSITLCVSQRVVKRASLLMSSHHVRSPFLCASTT